MAPSLRFALPSAAAAPPRAPKARAFDDADEPAPLAPRAAAPVSKAVQRQHADAADVDASTFDYDGVYDKMKQLERARSRSRGVAAFRHRILHDESERRQALLTALSQPTDVQAQAAAPMSDHQRAERAEAQGLHVELNDDHQIVDQRDLLQRGLNVMRKRKDARDEAPTPTSRAKRSHLMEEALLARVGDDSDDDEA